MAICKAPIYCEANRTGTFTDTLNGTICTKWSQIGELIRADTGTLCALITCGRNFAFEAQDLRDIADAMDKEKS